MEDTDLVTSINALAEAQDNALAAAEARHKTEINILTEKLEEQDNRVKKRIWRTNLIWIIIWVISIVGFDKISSYLRPAEKIFEVANHAIVWDDAEVIKNYWDEAGISAQTLFIERTLARDCKMILQLLKDEKFQLKLTDSQKKLITAHTRKKKAFLHKWEAQVFNEGFASAMRGEVQ